MLSESVTGGPESVALITGGPVSVVSGLVGGRVVGGRVVGGRVVGGRVVGGRVGGGGGFYNYVRSKN